MAKTVVILGPDDARSDIRMRECGDVARRIGGVELKHVSNTLPLDQIVEQAQDAVVILPAGPFKEMTELARRLPNLKMIQTFSAGTDYLDKAALAEMGVVVANNGGANAVAVAEHAIGLMFSVYRKLDRQIQSVKDGTWMAGVTGDRTDFHTLVGKRVGIVGLGRIGSRVAKRLQGWECEVVYHDVMSLPADYVEQTHATKVGFEELLKTSDIVTLHVPLERTTRHMMSDAEFEMMKESAILINTCRGPVVDEAALVRALQARKIFAAGLDVTEIEPIEMDNPLLKMENVILTPHLATRAIESEWNAAENTVTNAARVVRGEKPESVVPPV
jgi:phosphoglycerate dehydrogenase-like enzyme